VLTQNPKAEITVTCKIFRVNFENQRVMKIKIFNNRFFLIAAISLISATVAMAQDAAPIADKAANTGEFANIMQWIFLGVIGLLTVITASIVMRTMAMYQDLLSAAIAKEQGRELVVAVKETVLTPSRLDKICFQLFGTGAVAVEKEADIMLAHGHDGIYELDNRLPPWWVSMFYATIVFAFVYMGYYHFSGTERGQLVEYDKSMKALAIVRYEAADRQANSVNENTVAALTDKPSIDAGKGTFIGKCAACHGQKGEGTVGPNMTDDYWIHGGGIKNVFKIVKYGVAEKGMIAWGGQLKPSEIQEVASYLLTLRGTNPPNPKAPQGEIYTPEGAAVDSTNKK
jgi:cytochrome c oxidase cbb3-type subunit III